MGPSIPRVGSLGVSVQLDEPLLRFRSELQVTPFRGDQRTLYRVTDLASTASFELDELEYQVAQLLDGRRSAVEVSRAMKARGFHVEPRHVLAFHRELKGLGFLSEGLQVAAADHRGDADTFVLQGQQYLAQGKSNLAQGLFEAALVIDPEHAAALAGLQRCHLSPSRPDVDETDFVLAGVSGGGPRQSRWVLPLFAGLVATGALAVGAWLFASGSLGAYAAAPASREGETAAPVPGQQTMPEEPDVVGSGEPDTNGHSAVEQHTLPVLERAALARAQLTSPVEGTLVDILVTEGEFVSDQTPIFVVEHVERGDYSEVQRPRLRVRELQHLATESEAYAQFLRDTQRELRRARQAARRVERVTVMADAAGRVRMVARKGRVVQQGELLGTIASQRLQLTGLAIPFSDPLARRDEV